jgi:type VI secretion system protein ImpH
MGALPYAYTEQLIAAKREHGTALVDFFDIFNHRAQSLLYRSLRRNRYVLGKERALLEGSQDDYSRLMSALAGLPDATDRYTAHRSRLAAPLPPDALASFAGLFARRTRSSSGLALMLQNYFRLDIRIREFTGRWVRLAENERIRLGSPRGNRNPKNNGNINSNESQLGSGQLGQRSWQAAAFFCIEIRNPDANQLAMLRPRGTMLPALRAMARSYAGEEFDFHIEIFIDSHMQTTARLGRHAPADTSDVCTRLGWRGVLGRADRSDGAIIRVAGLHCATSQTDGHPSIYHQPIYHQ